MDLWGWQFESHLSELYNDRAFVRYKEAKKVHDERSKGTCKFYEELSGAVMEDTVELVDEDGSALADCGFGDWRWQGRGGK